MKVRAKKVKLTGKLTLVGGLAAGLGALLGGRSGSCGRWMTFGHGVIRIMWSGCCMGCRGSCCGGWWSIWWRLRRRWTAD